VKTLLFNPGPTNVSERVRQRLVLQDMCHREPEVIQEIQELCRKLVTLLNGVGTHEAILFASSGTGCNEAVISSMDGKALVINNGKYSDRLCEILSRYTIPHTRLSFQKSLIIDLKRVEAVLAQEPDITHIVFVHHETTTGVLTPLRELGKLGKQYNKVVVVDAISSLGGHMIDLRKDNIDFCTVSANKCLQSFPGISFVIAKLDRLVALKGKSRSYYFDLYKQWTKGKSGGTLFTPPVQLIFAASEACSELLEEGYENRVKRYARLAEYLRIEICKLGFKLINVPKEVRSNIVTTVKIPNGIDYWVIHDKLKERGITIYSSHEVISQGIFRIATLGNITVDDIDYLLVNIKEVLEDITHHACDHNRKI